jgi:hypothetical protein
MVADNGSGPIAWQYSGSGTYWNWLNDNRWTVSSIQIGGDGSQWMDAYFKYNYDPQGFVWWKYGGSRDEWTFSASGPG